MINDHITFWSILVSFRFKFLIHLFSSLTLFNEDIIPFIPKNTNLNPAIDLRNPGEDHGPSHELSYEKMRSSRELRKSITGVICKHKVVFHKPICSLLKFCSCQWIRGLFNAVIAYFQSSLTLIGSECNNDIESTWHI